MRGRQHQAEDPYLIIWRIVAHYRARLIILGFICALAGAAVGRELGRREYRSEALIRIPFVQRGVEAPDETGEMRGELFEAFLQSQRAVIGSRRLAELAAQQPEWIALSQNNGGTALGADASHSVDAFSAHLSVEHPPRTDYLTVAYVDSKPAVAAAAVRSITRAYSQIFTQQNNEFLKQQIDQLQAKKTELTARSEALDEQMVAAAGADVIAGADRLYDSAVERVVTLQDALAKIQIEMNLPKDHWGARAAETHDSLAAQENALISLSTDAKHDMQTLGEKREELNRLRALKEPVQKELDQTQSILDEIESQTGAAAQPWIVSDGETPLQAYIDHQWPYTGAGAAVGGLLPAAFVVLVCVVRSRYHFWGEAEADLCNDAPFLGVLPEISVGSDVDGADAARCLHQIRVMLQGNSPVPKDRAITYLVTSSSEGEGKTSLAAALALSFAASGSRTLLIDCDLIAQALTCRFCCQLKQGLKEALDGASIIPYCIPMVAKNLMFLPVGDCTANDATGIASDRIDKLLDSVRQSFDVILIDSGPILGSVEATTIAPMADGVIFTMTRDQKRSLIEMSLRKLRATHAKFAGVVFNRAESNDFQRSSYHSNYSAKRNGSHPGGGPRAPATALAKPLNGFKDFGPLVDAIAMSLPSAALTGVQPVGS